MKIMLLVSSMHAGGAERVAATLVNAWSARGDTVTLVPTFSSKGSCFYPLSDSVDLIWLADRARTRMGGPIAALWRLFALRRLIREKSPDVVISFLTNVNIAAILATHGLEVKLIVCERTNPILQNAPATLRCLRRVLYPRADMVTVQARAAVSAFSRMVPGMRRLAVIANPLPVELTDVGARALDPVGGQGERLCAMAMGRLVADKQFHLLIDAFSGVASAHPDWDLCIWGEGPDRQALQQRIAARGLAGRVRLAGRTERPWHELAQAQMFVLSSAVEGFPNVLLEAMALGLPCVAFDCPSGPAEMTREGTDALLVPEGDVEGLRQSLGRMMSEPALRRSLGERAAASVRRRYALPQVLAEWDTLFERIGVPVSYVRAAAASQDDGVRTSPQGLQ